MVLNPKNIRILSVAASALLLRSILIPFEFVTNRTLFAHGCITFMSLGGTRALGWRSITHSLDSDYSLIH